MSLTLLYKGKRTRFSLKLTKLQWLSALVVFSIISGSVIHLLLSTNAIPTDAEPLSSLLSEQQPVVTHAEPAVTPEYVTALTMKLAELQSHLSRLNALSDRLAEEANISTEEFNFEQVPPSGGPIMLTSAAQTDAVLPQKTLPEILENITALESNVNYEEKQLQVLESLTLGLHIENTGYLSGRPIKKGWLSSYFGIRKDPFNGRPSLHKGVDFAGKEGADVIATAAGVVTWSDARYGYGNLIEINHGKDIKTRYGHNKTLLVNVGDVVEKGQVIAKMGSTGRSTGPHVHYEILKNNRQIDPIKFVNRTAK